MNKLQNLGITTDYNSKKTNTTKSKQIKGIIKSSKPIKLDKIVNLNIEKPNKKKQRKQDVIKLNLPKSHDVDKYSSSSSSSSSISDGETVESINKEVIEESKVINDKKDEIMLSDDKNSFKSFKDDNESPDIKQSKNYYEEKIKILKEKLKNNDINKEEHDYIVRELKNELRDKDYQLLLKDQKYDDLEKEAYNNIYDLTNEIKDNKQTIDALERRIKMLEKSNKELNDDIIINKKKGDNNENNKLKQQIDYNKKEIEYYKEELENHKKGAKKYTDELNEKIKNNNQELRDKEDLLIKITNNNKKLETKIKDLEGILSQKEKRMQLEDKFYDNNEQIQLLNNEINNLRSEKDELLNAYNQLQNENLGMNQIINVLRNDLNVKINNIEELKNNINELKFQMKDVKNLDEFNKEDINKIANSMNNLVNNQNELFPELIDL